jgi:hypothetical protein
MKKIIVTTTINPVTKAIELFQDFPEWELVVIGDRKTPENYTLRRGHYFSPAAQEKYDPKLSQALGWNCVQRRNFGLLIAYEMGADVVAVVDDDNIPYESWGSNLLLGREVETHYYESDLPAFDPVGATNEKALWHRGFPLQLLSKRDYSKKSLRKIKPDIQADFWDGDPDIDAVCRMEHAPECRFKKEFFPMAANRFSPFNSQNTFMTREVLKNYFLFPYVGRMDDIWASYYVQAKGFKVVYNAASVYQQRNVHDLTRDMKQEYLGYENNLKIVTELKESPDRILNFLPDSSKIAFEIYRERINRA